MAQVTVSEKTIKEVAWLENELKNLQVATHHPNAYAQAKQPFPPEDQRATRSTNAALIGFMAYNLAREGKISNEAARIFNEKYKNIIRPEPQYPKLSEWNFPQIGKK